MVRIPLLPPPPTRGGKQFGSSPGKPSELERVAGHLARVAGEQERGKLIALLARRAAQGRALPGAATFSSFSSSGLAVAVWQPMLLDLQQGSDG